jgi:DNA-binding protein YbaB
VREISRQLKLSTPDPMEEEEDLIWAAIKKEKERIEEEKRQKM